jgi:hypothetical protein
MLFAQALATKLMEKRKDKHMTIMNPFLISLDISCDVNKQPICDVVLYKRFGQQLLHQFGCPVS